MSGNNDAAKASGEATADANLEDTNVETGAEDPASASVTGNDQSGHSAAEAATGKESEQTAGTPTTESNGAGPNGVDDPLGFGNERMPQDGIGEQTADSEQHESAEALSVRLQEAEAKASEYWDRLLRLQADMENQRKRAQNDVTKARKFALEGIVGDLLPVKDSLEMGIAAAKAEDADPASIIEGADLTLKMLGQVFEKNNIAEVNPVDEKFDPEFHQAMSMQEIEGKEPNTVTSVMQKGYTLNDRLVRPALVMVAK